MYTWSFLIWGDIGGSFSLAREGKKIERRFDTSFPASAFFL